MLPCSKQVRLALSGTLSVATKRERSWKRSTNLAPLGSTIRFAPGHVLHPAHESQLR